MAKRSTWLAAAVISTAFFMQAGFSDQRGGQRPSPEQTAVSAISQSPALRVILLGTAAGPPVKLDRFEASTLVEAGSEKLLFDCGRGATLRLKQFGVPLGEIGKLFLIKFSQGVDVLVHEVVDAKALRARLEGNHTPQQIDAIIAHHTTAEQAGQVFTRVKPRLAVYSHVEGTDLIAPTRTTYSGPLEVGEDLMAITIGENIDVRRFKP